MANDEEALEVGRVLDLARRERPAYVRGHLVREERMTTTTADNLLRLKKADLKIERARSVEPILVVSGLAIVVLGAGLFLSVTTKDWRVCLATLLTPLLLPLLLMVPSLLAKVAPKLFGSEP
jgi:hypothetical protein